MPDSHVTSAQIKNGKVRLSVQVDEFNPNEYVEISGQATQTGGAFANIYDIQKVPARPNGPDPNVPGDTGRYYIHVTGGPVPHQFRNDEEVTAIMRVARVWLTVLDAPSGVQPATAAEGTKWTADPQKVTPLKGGSW